MLSTAAIIVPLFFVALAGFGYLVHIAAQRLGSKDIDINAGMAAAHGMAAFCVLGGVLNLFGLISPNLVYALLLIGLLAGIFLVRNRWNARSSGMQINYRFWIPGGLILLTLLTMVVVSSGQPSMNQHDDYHAYLVFPHQMLEQGQLQADPFNERRTGILGGHAFLNASMLALVPLDQVGAMDRGVAWLVLVALLLGIGHKRRLPLLLLLAVTVAAHLFPLRTVNLSSYLGSAALFLAFLDRFTGPAYQQKAGDLLKTALLVAALCSLKTTVIAAMAFIGPAAFLADKRYPLAQRMMQGSLVALMALCMLLPWMLAMLASSGTLLYPILGAGTHIGASGGAAPLSVSADMLSADYLLYSIKKTMLLPGVISGLLLLALARLRYFEGRHRGIAEPVFLSAVFAALILSSISLGLARYSQPLCFAVYLFLLLEWSAAPVSKARRNAAIASLLLFAGLLLPTGIQQHLAAVRFLAADAAVSDVPDLEAKLARAQQAIPPGEQVLTVVSHPYLLDFSRNTFYVVDHAGSAGPQGGLPVHASAADLAAYLSGLEIHYLLYSFADEANYGAQLYAHRLGFSGSPYADRVRVLAVNNILFRRLILQLTSMYPVVYADDYSLLLNLEQP